MFVNSSKWPNLSVAPPRSLRWRVFARGWRAWRGRGRRGRGGGWGRGGWRGRIPFAGLIAARFLLAARFFLSPLVLLLHRDLHHTMLIHYWEPYICEEFACKSRACLQLHSAFSLHCIFNIHSHRKASTETSILIFLLLNSVFSIVDLLNFRTLRCECRDTYKFHDFAFKKFINTRLWGVEVHSRYDSFPHSLVSSTAAAAAWQEAAMMVLSCRSRLCPSSLHVCRSPCQLLHPPSFHSSSSAAPEVRFQNYTSTLNVSLNCCHSVYNAFYSFSYVDETLHRYIS